ncbi:MAG TPA: alpha/beta hydrolase-fold protein [Polyangiaceae bacterium]|nr:alpha/beta hydrolase-fold protein [Polyangiaceae bacterium]
MKSSLAPSALARLAVTLGLVSSSLLWACASKDPAADSSQGGSNPGGSGQPTAGTLSQPTGGTVNQTAGTDTGGAVTAGTDTGGSSSAGTGGAAGSASGGSGGSTAGGPSGLPEVSAEGDGDFIVGPSYTNEKELSDQGNPKGKSFSFSMPLASSKLFDGKDPTVTKPVNTNRSINVYVPAQYQDGTPAALLVIQDGPGELNQVSRALDNLTGETDPLRKLPPFIAIAVQNGGDDSIGSERGLEYDTVSDKYARFIDTEVLPAVINDAKIKAAYPGLKFTTDPSGRAAMGCSSGGAAAFTMGWLRPDLFGRVIGYSATLVAQQNPKAPESAMYPDGAWDYHSSKELIKNDTEGREKKLRIFINANENDNGSTAAESGKHNWLMANQRTAAALKAKGFHYKYIEGKGQGHCSGTVKSATMATVLMWLWRGYVPSGT